MKWSPCLTRAVHEFLHFAPQIQLKVVSEPAVSKAEPASSNLNESHGFFFFFSFFLVSGVSINIIVLIFPS